MILSSGTATDVDAAKAAARQAATRLETVLACRQQVVLDRSHSGKPKTEKGE
jgi:predicted house-cleaning NTP pyrophosphatase (Maf/HAM1 superfamily)